MSARVLVVDDQEDVLNTLSRFLTLAGYDIIATTRFDEAKRLIDERRPEILVTDVRLGAFNGLQLALYLRASDAQASIIVLSAWDDALLRQEADRIGAQYCMKPISKQELLDAIEAAQQRRA